VPDVARTEPKLGEGGKPAAASAAAAAAVAIACEAAALSFDTKAAAALAAALISSALTSDCKAFASVTNVGNAPNSESALLLKFAGSSLRDGGGGSGVIAIKSSPQGLKLKRYVR
jgi:hypothetical protein